MMPGLVARVMIAASVAASCTVGSTLPIGRGVATVDGAALAYRCEGAGSPSVVIEIGLVAGAIPRFDPEHWYGWAEAVRQISERTHVCIYNRRGLAGSEPLEPGVSRTSQDHVDDLAALLGELGVPTPVLLVGHSFGGLDLQLFTSQHRDLVAGLVLVDSTHSRGSEVFDFPSLVVGPEWVDVFGSELQARGSNGLGDVPLVVLSRGRNDGLSDSEARLWAELQADLATMSSNAEHVTLVDSGHLVMIDRPDAIAESVARLIEQTRQR